MVDFFDDPVTDYFNPIRMMNMKKIDPSTYAQLLGKKNEEFQMNYLRNVYGIRVIQEDNNFAAWDFIVLFGRESRRLRIQSKLRLSKNMRITKRTMREGHGSYNCDDFEYLMITRNLHDTEKGILSSKGIIFIPSYELKVKSNSKNLITDVPKHIADAYTGKNIREIITKTYKNFD
jgi:hypothetical protein